MNVIGVQERFDQFQEQAVSNILSDFTKKPCGRFLLVIPTGGGKTFTAVKAINRLFENGVLNPSKDKVLWTAHRTELITQAVDTFRRFRDLYPNKPNFDNNVDPLMISQAEEYLTTNANVKLVIIDEAHHAALKNINYGPLFAHKHIGILGLTATPSRHDGDPLDFERESFSIGFPDLVKKGIVLKPEVRKVEGGNFNITSIEDVESLEQLNNEHRNNKIITELQKHTEEYKKVIIYVGTVNHVKSLYNQLLKSSLKNMYDSISFITGGINCRDQERNQFIEQEKKYKRSIMVNVMVLSEGYDDPSVNTVVMATPSRSKLYYMQAVGRAIRHDPNDQLKKAYCVEVEDRLPNIRYRIDNRWLYSDVSDALEPAVVDKEYGTAEEFVAMLKAIYSDFNVPPDQRKIPPYNKDQRYTLLLFKRYLAPGKYIHFPLVITSDNRLQVSNIFNYLSERMDNFSKKGVVCDSVFRMIGSNAFELLPDASERRWVYEAMTHAAQTRNSEKHPEFISSGYPWIAFGAFHYRQPDIPEEILNFVAEMVNREDILKLIRFRDFEKGSYLIRLPLPLSSYMGRIVTASEYASLDLIVSRLKNLRKEKGGQDHRSDIQELLAETIIPIELAHTNSLILIARTDETYSMQLL